MSRTRSLLMCGSAALALALAPANHEPAQASVRLDVDLVRPQVSVAADGALVVTLEAGGDVRGLLTLSLAPDSRVATGDWVLVSRYIVDLPEGGDTPNHEEHIAFYERGTLRGSIAAGTLVFDAAGRLTGLDGARLAIAGGDLEFSGATGTATLGLDGLQDPAAGAGTLVLTQEVEW
jgi:hypothetical protein